MRATGPRGCNTLLAMLYSSLLLYLLLIWGNLSKLAHPQQHTWLRPCIGETNTKTERQAKDMPSRSGAGLKRTTHPMDSQSPQQRWLKLFILLHPSWHNIPESKNDLFRAWWWVKMEPILIPNPNLLFRQLITPKVFFFSSSTVIAPTGFFFAPKSR